MSQHYSDPTRENDPYALPDLETFCLSRAMIAADGMVDEDGEALEPGWYYWYCFPGCMPESEPVGPFDSEAAALAYARESCSD